MDNTDHQKKKKKKTMERKVKKRHILLKVFTNDSWIKKNNLRLFQMDHPQCVYVGFTAQTANTIEKKKTIQHNGFWERWAIPFTNHQTKKKEKEHLNKHDSNQYCEHSLIQPVACLCVFVFTEYLRDKSL